MKDQASGYVRINDYVVNKKEGIYWVSVIYKNNGHRASQASFIPRIEGVEIVEQGWENIPADALVLMMVKADKFFKRYKIFQPALNRISGASQCLFPFEEKSSEV